MLSNRTKEVTSARISIMFRGFFLLSIYLVLFSKIVLKEIVSNSYWDV